MLELVLRGSWEALRSLNKEIPCYGLTRNFLVGRQVGPQVGAMLKLVLGGFLERSWKGFGGSWRRFGAILGHLGNLLEGSWEALEASRDHFGSIFKKSFGFLSNLRK